MRRKFVPDKRCQNREQPVTKALEFPSCTGKSLFHQKWNREYEMSGTQRGRLTGMMAESQQRNGKQKWLP